ncbi:MAG: hypothetical protein QGG09_18955, partial [Pirellulaceae bacterium]|nr:hypothetical protein [Pirellulaceae bacterium]
MITALLVLHLATSRTIAMKVMENATMRITMSALVLAVTTTIWGCDSDDAPNAANEQPNPVGKSHKTPPPTNDDAQLHDPADLAEATPNTLEQGGAGDRDAESANELSSGVAAASSKPAGSVEPPEAGTGTMEQQGAAADITSLDVGGVAQPGGVIKGTVHFAGEQKKQRSQSVSANPFCAHARKDQP